MIFVSNEICKNPLVSVIVLTYNQEKYIAECLKSILEQDFDFEFEVIIGEDSSNDRTGLICRNFQTRYPDKVKLISREFNIGLIKNFIDLLNFCRGKFIAHCAGDDYWCDNKKLKKQVEFLDKNDEYGFIRTGYYLLYPKKNRMVVGEGHSKNQGYVFSFAKYGPVAASATIMFKKELLSYLDFNQFISRNFSIEDYPLQAILSKYTKFGYIDDITAVFRQTPDSGSRPTSIKSKLNYYKGYVAVKQYLAELFPGEVDCDDTTVKNFINHKRLRFAFEVFDYKKAKLIASEFEKPNKKEKKLMQFTNNIVLFYLVSTLKYIKHFLRS